MKMDKVTIICYQTKIDFNFVLIFLILEPEDNIVKKKQFKKVKIMSDSESDDDNDVTNLSSPSVSIIIKIIWFFYDTFNLINLIRCAKNIPYLRMKPQKKY